VNGRLMVRLAQFESKLRSKRPKVSWRPLTLFVKRHELYQRHRSI
jgi:hypothetical protein